MQTGADSINGCKIGTQAGDTMGLSPYRKAAPSSGGRLSSEARFPTTAMTARGSARRTPSVARGARAVRRRSHLALCTQSRPPAHRDRNRATQSSRREASAPSRDASRAVQHDAAQGPLPRLRPNAAAGSRSNATWTIGGEDQKTQRLRICLVRQAPKRASCSRMKPRRRERQCWIVVSTAPSLLVTP
jgi:hypothetical protein